ncbi:MAG: cytochrome P450 [Paracoccaceae bacterium]
MALDRKSDPGQRTPPRAAPVSITPPPAPLGLWQAFRTARRNVLEIVPAAAYREPIVMGGRGGRVRWRMLMDPPWVEHVLKTRAQDYPRSDVTRRLLAPREGQSLFTADWAEWRWQHRAMTPIFQHRNIVGLSSVMTESAEATAARMADAVARAPGEPVDVYEEMVTATFDVINDTALSGRESLDRATISTAITRFIETQAKVSFLDILGAPGWIPRPERMFGWGAKRIDQMIDRIIAARRERGPGGKPDLLDLLIAAEDPDTGRRMTPVELRNNLMAFIVAGHETTALALSWALYLLAFDPEEQASVRTAAQSALGDRAATAEDVPALGPVRQVIEEALRLYPPAGFLSRTALTEDEIAGVPVRKGETVMIPVYAMHRNSLLWDAPDTFRPSRFSAAGKEGRHRYAHLPFGAGPRICIGMSFALMEATIILATLVARFDFGAVAGREPEPRMVLTLRPQGGLPLRVRRL